jgi:Cof subfamily protein (haloacid dehalogenase superfamily)
LDGTLLDSNHDLQEESKLAIQKINNLGVKVIIATGRHYIDVKGVAEKLGISNCIIASNGTRAYDGQGNRLINHNMHPSAVEFMLDHKLNRGLHLNIYQGSKWLVFEDNQELLKFHQNSKLKYEKISDKSEVDFNDINKFYLYSQDLDALKLEEEYLKMRLGDKCDIFSSYPTVLEIMPKDINKGLAISELMEKEGVSSDEVIAFGDGLNDFEYIQTAGMGIAMKNGKDPIKEVAHRITQKSNDDDGVAHELCQIVAEGLLRPRA